ncbi:hypothetical protein [Actinoplanes sp. CA-252034]|uniref:hypothetical protein n=1 Tax=Actinoplanes sp. CA-252034 TaxID=3239906 RepID=UPI003D955CBD
MMPSFGIREFQLHMLATMPPSPRRDEALTELEAGEDDAKQALVAAREAGLFQAGHRVTVEAAMLGDPLYEFHPPETAGFEGSRALAFHLPVFRGFDFVLNVTPHGIVWGQGLARSRDTPVPEIRSLDDLQPWRFVRDEVASAMREPTVVDGFSFSESLSGFVASDEVVARFDFDLLQAAGPA